MDEAYQVVLLDHVLFLPKIIFSETAFILVHVELGKMQRRKDTESLRFEGFGDAIEAQIIHFIAHISCFPPDFLDETSWVILEPTNNHSTI